MFKVSHVNPERRDLLKQLLAIGALGAGGSNLKAQAQAGSDEIAPGIATAGRSDERYTAWRRGSLWRANLPERYPDVIVQATSRQQVIDALAFANANDLQVVCRASGHSTAGAPLRNGGMMIYISALNTVEIDSQARVATLGAAANMISLYGEAKRVGLDFPTADCTTVALSGFLLGGGIGRNCNHLTNGPVCNALLSAEVLLANGQIVTVDTDQNFDIFWAMRGCGPAFFGIVLSMQVRLFDPLGAYMASSYSVPLEAIPEIIAYFDERQPDQDARINISINISPSSEQSGENLASVRLTAYADQGGNAEAEARSLLARYASDGLQRFATDQSEYMPQDVDRYMFTRDPSGSTHTDNIYTNDATSLLPAIEAFSTRPEGLPVRMNLSHNAQYHAPYSNAISYSPEGRHFLSVYADWRDSRFDEAAYEWADRFSSAVEPYQQGYYLNQIDTGVYPEKVQRSFSESKWNRLAAMRRAYDPDNRFFSWVGLEDLAAN